MSDEQVHGRWDKGQQRYEDGEKSHPCVHAPVGPDWAGLRELPTPKPNYVVQLAAERDALVAENAKHRDDLQEWETEGAPAWVAERERQLSEVRAERDALRELVDSMTVEWHTTWSVSGRGLRRPKRLVSPWTVVEGEQK